MAFSTTYYIWKWGFHIGLKKKNNISEEMNFEFCSIYYETIIQYHKSNLQWGITINWEKINFLRNQDFCGSCFSRLILVTTTPAKMKLDLRNKETDRFGRPKDWRPMMEWKHIIMANHETLIYHSPQNTSRHTTDRILLWIGRYSSYKGHYSN